jgi:RHS repeat-associated protein
LVDVTTDRKGYTYRYEYDAAGRKTRFWYPAANGIGYVASERWTYTPTGQVDEYFNRAGQRLSYTYDNHNRETHRAWDGHAAPSVTTTYDVASRVLTRSNATGTLSYGYDAAGRLTSETQAIASGPVIVVGADYDADGRRTLRTATGEANQSFGYDARGQLISISQPGLTFGFGYDLSGARTQRTSPNGTASGYLYDAAGRLKTIDTYRVAGPVNILRQDFGYDSRDRRTWSLRDSSHGDSYTYQADSQLTGFRFNQLRPDQNPTGTAATVDSYAYDPNGNRTNRTEKIGVNPTGTVTTYSANALNEYANVSNGAIAHDNRGNVSIWQDWSYTYDAENRLVSAARTGFTVAFFYDAQGRLAKLTRNGAPEYRFFDGTRLFLRKNGAGTVLERTIWGPTANEALARWTPAQADGWRHYHHDPQNSPLALTDGAGLVFERYLYDAFGQDYVFDGAWGGRADSSVGNPWRFTGQEWMADLALHNFKARFYHHDLGRFLQQDPLRFDAGDLNLYRYAGNNTLNRVDPNGLAAKRNPSAIKWDPSIAVTAAQENGARKEENAPNAPSAKDVEEQKTEDPNNTGTRNALIDAKLSQGIYDKNFTGTDGYNMVGKPYTETNGLRAALFSNGTDNVLVYAGTSPSSLANWWANLKQAFGFRSEQYEAGIDLAVRLSETVSNLRYTGHSLGGGIASAAAIVTGGSARTFNAAGVHDNTLGGFERSHGPVTSYYSTFDVLRIGNALTPASVPGDRVSLGAAGIHGIGGVIKALGGGGP